MRFSSPVGRHLVLGLVLWLRLRAEKLIHDAADCPEVVVLSAGTLMMALRSRNTAKEGVSEKFGQTHPARHEVKIGNPSRFGKTESPAPNTPRSCAKPGEPNGEDCFVWSYDANSRPRGR